MAEIRLICPGCAAEYRLPENAIPPEGREVECSACGNVWQAGAQPVPATDADDLPPPSALPPLNRRLPDSVLDILRDEVEHERRARAVEEGAAPSPAPPAALPRAAADPEWPATTITTAITRHVTPEPAEVPPPPPQPAPEPATFLKRPATVETTTPVPQREAAVQDQAATVPERPVHPAPVPVPRPRRGGYAAGFSLAALLAAACVALYALAPAMADQGAFGEGLMQLRGQADQARMWLQDRAASLSR